MFRTNQMTTTTERLGALFGLTQHQMIPVVQTASSPKPQNGNISGLSAAGRRRRRRLSKFGAAPNTIKATWF